ncbi:AAA family ATPase [Blastopirellula retiformator]|uniref:ATPase RavA n=1 Tax=Blastopirellula retiformator TaxID=2527970 RepID=A0A5C5UV87_9BACT|nr:MoxR family ATPase [Blastopirellula retiformator]TWT30078.1 ATPase RavA [Blastopirellula retiformator]
MPAELTSLVAELETSISRVVLGKSEVVRKCLITLLAGEHLLLEDVPGVGKTLVGKALARSLDGEFCRLQFTPDLLPSDIVGSNVFNNKTHEFVFHRGPIFANIVIADEINRTSPRTQSALLEAMSDNQVSVDGVTHDLPTPFMVIATQNPFEFEGTYPLPESQLDRFLMRISMGYPDRTAERQILETHRRGEPVAELSPVLLCEQIKQLQDAVREIDMNDSVHEYLLDIIEATRDTDDLQVGASTRAAISLYRAAQSFAMIEGRDFVVPDDVKQLAVSVLAHRVIPKGYLHAGQREAVETIVGRIVDEVAVPT